MTHKNGALHNQDIIPVILAGGQGRRLWPLSTSRRPKPFLKLGDRHSLLQHTVRRMNGFAAPFIICHRDHRPLVIRQMKDIDCASYEMFLEPSGRGTAPAASVAAHYLAGKNRPDDMLLICSSDHAIDYAPLLREAVSKARPLAAQGRIVTFGIAPSGAETRYGYICRADDASHGVSRFHEKPGRHDAALWAADRRYYWNSGIFMLRVSTMLDALRRYDYAMFETTGKALRHAARLRHAIMLDDAFYAACPHGSLDRTIMEKADNLAVMPLNCGWRDVGTWPAAISYCLCGAKRSNLAA